MHKKKLKIDVNQPKIDSFFLSQRSINNKQIEKSPQYSQNMSNNQKRQPCIFTEKEDQIKKIKMEIKEEVDFVDYEIGIQCEIKTEINKKCAFTGISSNNIECKMSNESTSANQTNLPQTTPKKNSNSSPSTLTMNSFTPKKKSNLSPSTSTMDSVTPKKNSNSSLSTSTRNSFTPKKKSKHSSSISSPRKIMHFFVDEDKLFQAIENMNYVKERSTEPYEFDLEKIYLSHTFEYKYASLNTSNASRYDVGDVILPRETYADHMLIIISEVFCNKINCEYFTIDELDLIFSYLGLPAGAQILFIKLIRRKRALQRVKIMMQKEELLKIFVVDLLKHNFISSDISNYETKTLLNLLQSDEIKQLGKIFKCDKGGKEKTIKELLKIALNKTSMFESMSPSVKLHQEIEKLLGQCMHIPENILSIFDRIFTLFEPMEYPGIPTSDIFKMMLDIENDKVKFYDLPSERYPVFRNREHLLSYIKCKMISAKAIEACDNKNWEQVVSLSDVAFNHFSFILQGTFFESQQQSLPDHVKRFFPGHIWSKIMWYSIGVLKKLKMIDIAEKYLNSLINQDMYIQKYRGRWYEEMSLIKSYYQKDNNCAALWLIKGLENNNLNIIDIMSLLKKLKTYVKKKTIKMEVKNEIDGILNTFENSCPLKILYDTATVTIVGNKLINYESSKGKSTWLINGSEKIQFAKVEEVAMNHYNDKGYYESLHCEGALPVSLFVLLFWDELYKISIPGAFLSPYQSAPFDLFTPQFLENRKAEIEARISTLSNLNPSAFVDDLTQKYILFQHYRTIFPNLYQSEEQFRSLIKCMGVHDILRICEKLLEDYRLWRSGFPDLIVWNADKYKIVEVKGPNDSLSTKQLMWMQYLQQCDICTELCKVQESTSK